MGLCRRYAKNNGQAETFFNEAFVSVFKHLHDYKEGSDFDDWVRAVFLESIVQQMKNNRTDYYVTTTTRVDERKTVSKDLFNQEEELNPNTLTSEEYVQLLQRLPSSFRAVFNLFVIDRYELKDVSRLLEISEQYAQNSLERSRFEFNKLVLQRVKEKYAA